MNTPKQIADLEESLVMAESDISIICKSISDPGVFSSAAAIYSDIVEAKRKLDNLKMAMKHAEA